jgi:hypothetical protein
VRTLRTFLPLPSENLHPQPCRSRSRCSTQLENHKSPAQSGTPHLSNHKAYQTATTRTHFAGGFRIEACCTMSHLFPAFFNTTK